MLPHLRWLGLILISLFLAAPAWADDAPSPPATQTAPAVLNPVPNLTEQETIDNQLKAIDGPIPPGKLEQYPALAAKLLAQGSDASAKPDERYVLLKHAAELSADSCEPAVMLRAFQQLDDNFVGERTAWKLDLVRKAVASPNVRAKAGAMEDACLSLSDAWAAGDDYESAIKCASMGQALARRVNDAKYVQVSGAKVNQYRAAQQEYGPAEAAMPKLSSDPNDPAANLAVGRYACFIKGDWKNGLPMLALGGDPTLKALAQKELNPPADPDKQVEIANGWWDLSQTKADPVKTNIRNHSLGWYQKAMPKLTGLNKELATRRLAEQNNAAAAAASHATGGAAGANPEATAAADALAADLNNPRFWKSAGGMWTRTRDGAMMGIGAAQVVFTKDLPSDCTIGFRINVMGGAGPRVSFEGGGVIFGSDGMDQYFMILGSAGARGSPIPYNLNEPHTVEFEFTGSDFKCMVDGRVAASGQRGGVGPMQLRLASGDDINPGTVCYWDFRVKLNAAPAPAPAPGAPPGPGAMPNPMPNPTPAPARVPGLAPARDN